MPKREDIKKILVIGSGPITIGQAAEFDYSGTQALKALKSVGFEVVIVNSNSATIMTDPEFSDAVYIEPLKVEFLEKIIEKERPDALLPTLGGQTALNLAVELAEKGILDKYGVELIGAKLESIKKAEDRELFKETMQKAGLEVLRSRLVNNLTDAIETAKEFGYPVVIRPSFTLGGTGGGIAFNEEELKEIVTKGLVESPVHTVLVEESVLGWKEYELEVVRDRAGNFIVVCSIENLDPMGIHTGDSITVAPSQTLTDVEYQKMRDAAYKVIDAIGIETGGSNIQFAVDPKTGRMVVIEMNPRVSRSSALASKATGYPIAKVAALLAVGFTLDEIPNYITGKTTAAFEPSIDYVVVKIPRFQLEKFPGADPRLDTQMKSVGEVMAIGRTFKEALGKALRSLELDAYPKLDLDHIKEYLANPTPERISYIFAAFRNGMSVEEVHEFTKVDKWFLREMRECIDLEEELEERKLDVEVLKRAKQWGYSDRKIAELWEISEKEVRKLREAHKIFPVYKMVDTCAAEFEAETPYYYSTYNGAENEAIPSDREKIMILGSGPNRIGQGIEFDYTNVHGVWAFQEEGYEVIMVNSNPETVSTDYDTSDRLYFEPLTVEDVLEIVRNEKPKGVVVAFGGQTPLKIARYLAEENVPIIGTSFESIEVAEDREKFAKLLKELGLKCPPFGTATSIEEALKVAEKLGYPVLVRPSYVLGGRAMAIVDTPEELERYVLEAAVVSPGYPILIDKFLEDAIELDVDVVSDGRYVWIAGLMEQIEEAGVHSGDSACVLPPVSLPEAIVEKIEKITHRLIKALKIVGIANIQMAVKDEEVYIIEANPRASRTVPFVSKAIGVPVARIAAKVMIGKPLPELLSEYFPYPTRPGLEVEDLSESEILPTPWPKMYSVKEVVIPFHKFSGTDVLLGPEMRSTGEVMGIGEDLAEAFAKAQIAADNLLPTEGAILATIADRDKRGAISLLAHLADMGFEIYATEGTAKALKSFGVDVYMVPKVGEGRPDVIDLLEQGRIKLVVITHSSENAVPVAVFRGRDPFRLEGRRTVGYMIRTTALKRKIPYITTVEALRATVSAIRKMKKGSILNVRKLIDIWRV